MQDKKSPRTQKGNDECRFFFLHSKNQKYQHYSMNIENYQGILIFLVVVYSITQQM
jgi:hypothetical protein